MFLISVGKISIYLMLEELIHIAVMRDSVLLLQCTWGSQSSALLQGVGWFVIGVSVQCIGPVFKSQEVSELLLGCPDPLICYRYAVLRSRYKITNTPLKNPGEIICVILTTLLNGSYQNIRLLHKPVPYVGYAIPILRVISLILPRSRTGKVWFYTSTSNKRAARPKLYTKSLTRDLKLMYSRFTLVIISINLNSSQLNMFREIILPIFRSTRLCVTACGVMHTPRCCRPKAGNIVGCALHLVNDFVYSFGRAALLLLVEV